MEFKLKRDELRRIVHHCDVLLTYLDNQPEDSLVAKKYTPQTKQKRKEQILKRRAEYISLLRQGTYLRSGLAAKLWSLRKEFGGGMKIANQSKVVHNLRYFVQQEENSRQ